MWLFQLNLHNKSHIGSISAEERMKVATKWVLIEQWLLFISEEINSSFTHIRYISGDFDKNNLKSGFFRTSHKIS